jgi:hypothetical protein
MVKAGSSIFPGGTRTVLQHDGVGWMHATSLVPTLAPTTILLLPSIIHQGIAYDDKIECVHKETESLAARSAKSAPPT